MLMDSLRCLFAISQESQFFSQKFSQLLRLQIVNGRQ